jgi:dihydrofolate synthase/folylpolyglutamate synthase
VSTLLGAALESAGWRTGVFTSPHVESMRERLRIDGELWCESELGRALHAAADAREAAAAQGSAGARATRFDAMVAAALWSMRAARIDWGVVECGLGGRHDSTAELGAELAVLTSVELEHTEVLGSTLGAIASEKAGIVSRGGSLVAAVAGEAATQAERVARERGAAMLVLVNPSDDPLGPSGNLATARAALDLLGRCGARCGPGLRASVSTPGQKRQSRPARRRAGDGIEGERHYGEGVVPGPPRRLGGWLLDTEATRAEAASRLPARQECRVSPCGVRVLLDGAHTAASAAALVGAIRGVAPPPGVSRTPPVVLVGLAAEKDAAAFAAALRGARPALCVATAAGPAGGRADGDGSGAAESAAAPCVPPAELASALAIAGCGTEHRVAHEIGRALELALGEARERGTWLLVVGSFRLCGEIRNKIACREIA